MLTAACSAVLELSAVRSGHRKIFPVFTAWSFPAGKAQRCFD